MMDQEFLCSSSPDTGCSTPEKAVPNAKARWTWILVLTSVTTILGCAIPVGYNLGVINAPAVIVQDWCNQSAASRYDIHLDKSDMDLLWPSIVSIFIIGGMAGSLSGAWLADHLGRKGAMIASGAISLTAAVLFVVCRLANSIELMFLGRILAGIASGLVTAVMPMYLTEIAPIDLRGAVGVMCPLGVTAGVLVGQILGLPFLLGTESSWHYLLGGYALLTLVSATSIPWLPESPKYLHAVRGCRQKAIKELSRLRELPEDYVCRELEEKSDVATESWSIIKLLTTKRCLLNLALVVALQAGQQCSGINAVFYYSVRIFLSAGLSLENAQLANLGAGGINFAMAIISIPLVNHFSRRAVVVSSGTLVSIFLVLLCISRVMMSTVPWMSMVAVFSVLAFVLVYGTGIGPIPYFIASELFDVGPRPAAMALGSVANWSGNFLVGLTFPSIDSEIGPYSFLLFATSTILLTIFVGLCLPETNLRVLEQSDAEKNKSSEKDNV